MAQSTPQNTYSQGHSKHTLATQQRRTAEADAGFLLPHIKETDHILDVGCGPGSITIGFAKYVPKGTIIGIDISADVLQVAKNLAVELNVPTSGPGSVVFEEGNILGRLPYPDNTFDIVYSSQVFGHLNPPPDIPRRALEEVRRVLKPGGIVATRDGCASHFYPRSLDLDRLWTGNSQKVFGKGAQDTTGTMMLAIFRSAGFDVDGGKVVLGAGTRVFSGKETRDLLLWRAEGQLKEGDPLRQSWLDAGITEEEIKETLVAVRKFAETEDAWLVSLECEMLGWK